MDLQGNRVPAGHRSTKVTQDPAARNPTQESTGAVTNDSLAAESTKSGGGFTQNRGAAPLGVSGNQSTMNTTDTSAASKMSSTSTGAARGNPNSQERYPEAMSGQGNFPGTHVPETGYTGGSTAAKQSMGINQGAYPASQMGSQPAQASGSGYHSQYDGGQAPSYVDDVLGRFGNHNPKGKNLKEGGFDDDPKNNASFTSEIGSDQDPGRYAEKKFELKDAEAAAHTSTGMSKKPASDRNWYQPLESDQRA